MTGYLLDTNTALIALTTPDALSRAVRSAVLRAPNVLRGYAAGLRFSSSAMRLLISASASLTWWTLPREVRPCPCP